MSEIKKKTNEEESKEGFGHLSRREFLRDAGLVIGGSTMGSIAFAAAKPPVLYINQDNIDFLPDGRRSGDDRRRCRQR